MISILMNFMPSHAMRQDRKDNMQITQSTRFGMERTLKVGMVIKDIGKCERSL